MHHGSSEKQTHCRTQDCPFLSFNCNVEHWSRHFVSEAQRTLLSRRTHCRSSLLQTCLDVYNSSMCSNCINWMCFSIFSSILLQIFAHLFPVFPMNTRRRTQYGYYSYTWKEWHVDKNDSNSQRLQGSWSLKFSEKAIDIVLPTNGLFTGSSFVKPQYRRPKSMNHRCY